MNLKKPFPLHWCAAVMAASLALSAQARCIDEDNVELRAGAVGSGAAGSSADARTAMKALVQEAIRHSNAVGASKLLAEAAELDIQEAKAGRWPVVIASAFGGRTGTEVLDTQEGLGKQARASLTVTAPIYDGGRISATTDWRRSLAEAARLGQISLQEQIALQTVSLAMERNRYNLQAQVYQQYARKMSCLVEALETIVNADKGRSSELVQARKTLQQAELSQAQTLSAVRQMEIRLRRFVGDKLPTIDGIAASLLQLPPLTDFLAQADSAPDIAQLGAQADASDNYARSVSAARLPQVSLGVNGTKTKGTGDSTTWSAGVNVSMPLFAPALGYASDSSRKRAEAARLQQADALESRKFRMAEVYEQATAAYDRAQRTVSVLRDSERVRNFTLQQWQQLGRRSLFDVMSAEGEHYNLRVQYVNSLFDAQQSTVLLWSMGMGVQARLD